MQAHVATNIAENKKLTFWAAVALFVGGFICWGGVSLYQSWMGAEAPKTKVVSLYLTPLAKVVPGYSFSPGYPSVTVSMDDFRSQSTKVPYVVSYSKKWETGERMEDSQERKIFYIVKRQDADIYLVSGEYAPTFDTPAYYEHTAFNPQNKTFFSVVDGVSYQAFGWSILLMLIGVIVGGVGGWILVDLFLPPHKRVFA